MTDKQKRLVDWIQSKTGVRYNSREMSLNDYIREWRPKAEDIAEEERMMCEQDRLSVDNEVMNG